MKAEVSLEARRRRARELTGAKDEFGLLELAEDSRWEVRREALRGYAEVAGARACDRLLAGLFDDRARGVRRACAEELRARAAAILNHLADRLDHRRHGPACAAFMACVLPGRERLAARRDKGARLLLAAFEVPDLPIRVLMAVTKALVICPYQAVGDRLAANLAHDSVVLAGASGRALYARWDERALPWARRQLAGFSPDLHLIAWVGDLDDGEALPALRRLASFWRSLLLGGRVREAARSAIERIEERLSGVSDAAISRAPAPAAMTEAALSLWREDETAEEARADE